MEQLIFPSKIITGSRGIYILKSLRKQGGSCQIWRAEDKNGRPFALKIFNKSIDNEKKTKDQLAREGITTLLLKHPSICKIHDYSITDEHHILIMEYLEGIDLEELIENLKDNNAHLPIKIAVEIVAQIAEALHYAHNFNKGEFDKKEGGIVHKDIKPSNIFITNTGEIKLLDFGVAKNHDLKNTNSSSEELGHTPLYTAPELWERGCFKPAKYSSQHDIYSLGLVFYELVTNEKAFKNIYQVHQGHIGTLDKYVGLPKEIVQFYDKCTHTLPRNRFISAKNLLAEIKPLRPAQIDFKKLVTSVSLNKEEITTSKDDQTVMDTVCTTLLTQGLKTYQLKTFIQACILIHIDKAMAKSAIITGLLEHKLDLMGISHQYVKNHSQTFLQSLRYIFHCMNKTEEHESHQELGSFEFLHNESLLQEFCIKILSEKSRNEVFTSLRKEIRSCNPDHIISAKWFKMMRYLLKINPLQHRRHIGHLKKNNKLIHAILMVEEIKNKSITSEEAIQSSLDEQKQKLRTLTCSKYISDYRFSEQEQKAIYCFLFHAVYSDKRIHANEKIQIKNIITLLGPLPVGCSELAYKKNSEYFQYLPREYRLWVLTLIIDLSKCDYDFHPNEKLLLLEYATMTGLSQKELPLAFKDLLKFFIYILENDTFFLKEKSFTQDLFSRLGLSFNQISKGFMTAFFLLLEVKKTHLSFEKTIIELLDCFPNFQKRNQAFTLSNLKVTKDIYADFLIIQNEERLFPQKFKSRLFEGAPLLHYGKTGWPENEAFDFACGVIISILQSWDETRKIKISRQQTLQLTPNEEFFLAEVLGKLNLSKSTLRKVETFLNSDYGIAIHLGLINGNYKTIKK